MRKLFVFGLLAITGCAIQSKSYQKFIRDEFSLEIFQFPVTVNYNFSVDSFAKSGQREGRYFLLDPEINTANFSITVAGEKKIKMRLAHFDKKPITHLEILEELRKRHFRPANTQEFLCFVEKYSWHLMKSANLLGQFEVICLSSPRRPQKHFYSQVMRWRVSEQLDGLEGIPFSVMDFACMELNWLPDSYFAIVSMDEREEDVEIKPKTLKSDFGKESE